MDGFEPFNGSEIRVTITIGGRPIVDSDLTLLYLRAKMNGGETELPVWFLPFVPTEENETPAPVNTVKGAFAFKIMES